MPTNVLIAGGGPAALEAALALHRFAGDRVVTTVLAPESHYTYRPLSVVSPFTAGSATAYPLERIAARAGAPTKIAGRELAGYLEGLDEEAGRPAGLPVNVKVGDPGTGSVEVLSLH